jgi:5-methylcytosine-specific restriction endonuclease McrA
MSYKKTSKSMNWMQNIFISKKNQQEHPPAKTRSKTRCSKRICTSCPYVTQLQISTVANIIEIIHNISLR